MGGPNDDALTVIPPRAPRARATLNEAGSMDVFVGGSFRGIPRDAELCQQFVAALGTAIVRQGHVLLNGCRSSLDHAVAAAAHEWLTANGGNSEAQIVSYCLKGEKPVHSLGRVRSSALLDWKMDHSELNVPEQIGQATVTLFIAGSEGTFWSRNWAAFARKPILGVPRFGGAGEVIYEQELKRLRETSPESARDYETLNSLSDDMEGFAEEVVQLVERLVIPGNVFVVMSFKREYRDVFASCKEVCREFRFTAETTNESPSLERIVPRIEAGIRNCAFVIADVSEPSPNVFYELGYAKALGKQVVVTAREGTKLPFDIGDVPTIFWQIQEDLKDGLRKYLPGVVDRYGR